MLDTIRIVLVNTSHPGNIGSTARAMKTMGLSSLVLVKPDKFPNAMATAMASGADDILHQAKVVDSLEEALTDVQYAFATSARDRRLNWTNFTAREAGSQAHTLLEQQTSLAFVFGREQAGLSNEELQLCQAHVQIPSNADYGVLNLAQAVQIICYELRMAYLANANISHVEKQTRDRLATGRELNYFYEHLQTVLQQIGFLDPSNPRQVLPRLRRLFQRALPEHLEIKILRGMLTQMQWRMGIKGKSDVNVE